jgi:hypothetical protein
MRRSRTLSAAVVGVINTARFKTYQHISRTDRPLLGQVDGLLTEQHRRTMLHAIPDHPTSYALPDKKTRRAISILGGQTRFPTWSLFELSQIKFVFHLYDDPKYRCTKRFFLRGRRWTDHGAPTGAPILKEQHLHTRRPAAEPRDALLDDLGEFLCSLRLSVSGLHALSLNAFCSWEAICSAVFRYSTSSPGRAGVSPHFQPDGVPKMSSSRSVGHGRASVLAHSARIRAASSVALREPSIIGAPSTRCSNFPAIAVPRETNSGSERDALETLSKKCVHFFVSHIACERMLKAVCFSNPQPQQPPVPKGYYACRRFRGCCQSADLRLQLLDDVRRRHRDCRRIQESRPRDLRPVGRRSFGPMSSQPLKQLGRSSPLSG